MSAQLRDWLRHWPKVDIHRHLEGTVRLETAWTWAQTNPALANLSREELRSAVQFDGKHSFADFLAKFRTLRQLYTTRDAIEQVANEAIEDAADDNVRYLELRFSPEHFSEQTALPMDDVATWVMESANAAAAERHVIVRYILTIGREYAPAHAAEILSIGLRRRDLGVVGFDLAGDELRYPNPPFEGLYARARQEGLGVTIHAGEAGGASHVRTAITEFSAHRIGHGIRSIEDPSLMETLRTHGIALEVCPTSNVQTGAVDDLQDHPLPALLDARVPVVLCTDDPSISRITLTDEWTTAITTLGLTIEGMADLTRQAVEHTFLPRDDKDRLRETLSNQIGKLLAEVPAGFEQYTERGRPV